MIFPDFQKILQDFVDFREILHFWKVSSPAEVCRFCRSRKMLKNDYLVAKIGVDTAENEPSKV